MSRRGSLPKSKSLMDMDLTMRKSMTIKTNEDTESEKMETSTNLSSPTHADEQKSECSSGKLIKSSSAILKPNHKHKHRCHHHHHHRQQLINKSKKPVTIIREIPAEDNQQQSSPTNANQDSKSETIKGNTPLQSVENKLVSQRNASTSETQVGNYSSLVYDQCCPTVCNTTAVQQIICEEDCCLPPATVSCTCASCVLPQSNALVCVPQQQQQQQIFICSDPCPTAQPLLCVPQTPVQQSPTFIIQQQQPQIQSQPIQILQSPAPSAVQFIQVASATPQVLYQRPYDPLVIPFQNQQVAIAQNPLIALSQPSYAPARQLQTGPRMFQNALIRVVSDRTGVPALALPSSGFQMAQSPLAGSPFAQRLAPTARPLFNNNPQRSTSLPIVPLTPGGLLIPFEASQPSQAVPGGNLPGRVSIPPRLRNFEDIRQRLQQRAQLLASLRQQNPVVNQPFPPLPLQLADPPVPRAVPLVRSSTTPFPLPPPSINARPRFSVPIPTLPNAYSSGYPNSSFASNPIVPPPVIPSQTPYAGGRLGDLSSSSSSSSRSSASSTRNTSAAPSGLIYSQPSIGALSGGSVLGGPASTYQSL